MFPSDHEVWLYFLDIEAACAFKDWWGMHGADSFVKWVKDQRKPEHRR